MHFFTKSKKTHRDSVRSIPGPKGKWFIGDAIEFDADPVGWMMRTQKEYGDIVRLDNETIVINNPLTIGEVFARTNSDFLLDNAMTAGNRGRRELVDGLSRWMQSRKHLGKALNHTILNKHISRATQRMESEVSRLANKEVELFHVSQYLLGCAVADFCLGADEDFDQVFKQVEAVFWASLDVTDSEESRLPWMPRPIAKRAQRMNNELVSLITEVVRRRRSKHPKAGVCRDALDHLVDNFRDVPEEQLVAAVRLMMVTAHGPSGAVFSWSLLRLAEDPRLVEKVRGEMEQNAEAALLPKNFPVTNAVLKETMRMHPANWLMGRTASGRVELSGYILDKDCRVLFSPYIVHRDPRYWSEPEKFSPERWLTGGCPYSNGAYFPFGSGPRVCPGALLGPIQLVLGLRAVLTNYDIKLPPLSSVRPAHSTLLTPHKIKGKWVERVGCQVAQ